MDIWISSYISTGPPFEVSSCPTPSSGGWSDNFNGKKLEDIYIPIMMFPDMTRNGTIPPIAYIADVVKNMPLKFSFSFSNVVPGTRAFAQIYQSLGPTIGTIPDPILIFSH